MQNIRICDKIKLDEFWIELFKIKVGEYPMNFTTWLAIAVAIIVPITAFIFHNKE